MGRDLDGPLPDVPAMPPGLTLAPYAAERDEAVRQAHREAFADHWGATPPDEQRWTRWYTGPQTFRPDVSWLVLDGEEVAAYLLSYFWAADAEATGVREAFVGQLGVRPAWRRRGLGGLLLATALRVVPGRRLRAVGAHGRHRQRHRRARPVRAGRLRRGGHVGHLDEAAGLISLRIQGPGPRRRGDRLRSTAR